MSLAASRPATAIRIEFSPEPSATAVAGDVVVVPITGRTAPASTVEFLSGLGADLATLQRVLGDHLSEHQCLVVPTPGRSPFTACVLVDVAGPASADVFDAAAAAARACSSATHVVTTITEAVDADRESVRAAVEGFVLGWRRFDRHRSGPVPTSPQLLTIVDSRVPDDELTGRALAHGLVVARTTNWVRDLVDSPPSHQSPSGFAAVIAEHASTVGVEVRILGPAELEQRGMGAMLAVGAGSAQPPCLVELRHRGHGDGSSPIALVGKGITFDSGGLDLKTLHQMSNMKHDMAGAAAVAGAVCAAAELALEADVIGVLALAENMTGGAAMRPGDVARHPDGSTTEILGPDAEGRLVLGDALIHARQFDPSCLVDVGTLTGGGGLGPAFWALIGDDRTLLDELLAAGIATNDRGWELPMWPAYRRFLTSRVADRSNIGGSFRYGFDTLLAAQYLRDFTSGIPWAHLDISSAASRDAMTADRSWPVGATGAPVRPLVEWLVARSARPLVGDHDRTHHQEVPRVDRSTRVSVG